MKRGIGTVFKIIAIVIWSIGSTASFVLIFPAFDWDYGPIYILYSILSLLGTFVLGMIAFSYGEVLNWIKDIRDSIRQNQ